MASFMSDEDVDRGGWNYTSERLNNSMNHELGYLIKMSLERDNAIGRALKIKKVTSEGVWYEKLNSWGVLFLNKKYWEERTWRGKRK